ncbi:uncharacterized protein KY384_000245 [Bacidia gigantensis]|uniref:uncharacterized protein n=1 Tax=Bacidia gigantensis TaxID=2732470 RepID=UPI001D03DED8|nr:uncharacterized protein KY384_000245 [Bacidia gigantensis]KAG8526252.1 hypothetical protein KY384_000245 [Bacidia gigantensis]
MEDHTFAMSKSQASSVTSNGTKRKRGSEIKFYAVRIGHTPGVYSSWADCLQQVKGYPKATFKSFPTLTDAERFVAGEEPFQATSTPKFYAVKNGRTPGIYTDWQSVQEQIKGWTKPKHRCFGTKSEAQKFLDEPTMKIEQSLVSLDGRSTFITSNDTEERPNAKTMPIVVKKTKTPTNGSAKKPSTLQKYCESDYQAGYGPLPSGATDGFDPRIKLDPVTGTIVYKSEEERQATKAVPGSSSQIGPIRIHTDGSSIGNGTAGAFAGIGVYFGRGDKRNISEALQGPKQTNQRAELTAVQRALELVPRNRDIVIITDSKYSIDCLTNWFQTWRRNGWKNAAGKAVENKDLIENILCKIEERDRLRVLTNFEWVKGHASEAGNIQVDKLANEGARKGNAGS